MKKIAAAFVVLAMVSGIAVSGWSIFEARNYGFDPPPYEVNLWGSAGLLFANYTAAAAAVSNTALAFNNSDVSMFRTSWGIDFMFRIGILGLGLEYSQQTLQKIQLNTNKLMASPTYANLGGTLEDAYTSDNATALLAKVKVEAFNFIGEGGVGFYWPNQALYISMNSNVSGTNVNYVWSQTATASTDPKVMVMFSLGYPMQISRDMDLVPFVRVNIFGSQTAISGHDLTALLSSSNPTTLDIGLKLRIVFH
jgi:hypothetical protein